MFTQCTFKTSINALPNNSNDYDCFILFYFFFPTPTFLPFFLPLAEALCLKRNARLKHFNCFLFGLNLWCDNPSFARARLRILTLHLIPICYTRPKTHQSARDRLQNILCSMRHGKRGKKNPSADKRNNAPRKYYGQQTMLVKQALRKGACFSFQAINWLMEYGG